MVRSQVRRPRSVADVGLASGPDLAVREAGRQKSKARGEQAFATWWGMVWRFAEALFRCKACSRRISTVVGRTERVFYWRRSSGL